MDGKVSGSALSTLVQGVALSAVCPLPGPFGPNLCLPHGTIVVNHGKSAQLSLKSLHFGISSYAGQVVPKSLESRKLCFIGRPAARETYVMHPDKQICLKGPAGLWEGQVFRISGRQSHFNDVDRWHPVVVLGELREKRRWNDWRSWKGSQELNNEHEDASCAAYVFNDEGLFVLLFDLGWCVLYIGKNDCRTRVCIVCKSLSVFAAVMHKWSHIEAIFQFSLKLITRWRWGCLSMSSMLSANVSLVLQKMLDSL